MKVHLLLKMVVFQPAMWVFGGFQPAMKAEVDKEEKLSTSELLDRVKTVLGERCNETPGLLEPAYPCCSKGGAVVVWLQAVTSGKNPWKNHHPVAMSSSQEFFRVADILKTSWSVVYPVVYDLFHTSFLVIEMRMIPVLGSTRDSWILGNKNKLLVWVM